MNILIADDEALIRTSLQLYLEATQVPNRCIFQAENTTTMLSYFKEKRIDLAFVDISMPGTNGLTAIEAAQKLQPETHFYVLTGYSKFEYAQKALQLHIEDYLLKPVSPERIRQILEKERAYRQIRFLQTQSSFSRLFQQSFHGQTTTPAKLPDLLVCFSGKMEPEPFQSVLQQICNFLEQELDLECIRCSYLCWEYLLLQQKTDIFKLKHYLDHILRQFPCSILIKTRGDSEILLQSVHDDSLQLIFAPLGICHTSVDSFSELCKMGQLFAELLYFSNEQNYDQFCLVSARFATLLSQKKDNMNDHTLRQLIDMLEHFFPNAVSNSIHPEDVSSLLRTYAANYLLHHSGNDHSILVIKQYVETHYQEKITLPQLAAKFGYTPNYISSAFRKYTGFTVTQYLNQIRLSHACRLLTETNMTIQETADATGYSDSNYFTRMFTQQYHCTPSNYRKKQETIQNR